MNGSIERVHGESFDVHVRQSFGNCAQYIQAREPRFVAPPASMRTVATPTAEGAILSPLALRLVKDADTFFIASASADAGGEGRAEGVDVSHRGGKPGFVRVTEEDGRTVLTSPDFRGNFLFNTLGNLLQNPRAGLLFVDFTSGTVLSLRGDTEIVFDGPLLDGFRGAERLLRFRVAGGWLFPEALPLRWSPPEFAPQLARTGAWG